GTGKVNVIARSGSLVSRYTIDINVRNPNPKIVKYFESMVEAGKTSTIDFQLIGVIGTNHATLEVSSIPPIDLSRRLEYLLTYPYGCVEQTTSAAFPQLYLDKMIQLTSDERKYRDENIKRAIQRLYTMMVPGGGFAYWPGAVTPNEWG